MNYLRLLVLFIAVGINVFVFAIGSYFFYDQVLAPAFNLHSSETKFNKAVSIVNSSVRDPQEQVDAIARIENLRDEVSEEVFANGVSEVRSILPTHTIAAEVFDAWVAFEKRAFPPQKAELSYKTPSDALENWTLVDPIASRLRQKFYMDKEWWCDTSLLQLAHKAVDTPETSAIEKSIAGQALARKQNGVCNSEQLQLKQSTSNDK